MSTYYAPEYECPNFHCIYCNVFSVQSWSYLEFKGTTEYSGFDYCICMHCGEKSFWFDKRMLIPTSAPVPPHHIDIPEECKSEYNEARDIVARSTRAAAALMRLCIQKLMISLGEKGNNINEDIGALVAKGLPIEVQQALDYCRVIGNNAVHPGELNLNDDPNIAHSMFEMVNFIVDDRISKPKKIAALYSRLPKGAIQAVEKRDAKLSN